MAPLLFCSGTTQACCHNYQSGTFLPFLGKFLYHDALNFKAAQDSRDEGSAKRAEAHAFENRIRANCFPGFSHKCHKFLPTPNQRRLCLYNAVVLMPTGAE